MVEGTQYAIFVDAGSSGTRMYGYQWEHQTVDDNIIINEIFKYQSAHKGGIQTLGLDVVLDSENPDDSLDTRVKARVEVYFNALVSKHFFSQKRVKITTAEGQSNLPEYFEWRDSFETADKTTTEKGNVKTTVELDSPPTVQTLHSSKNKKNYTLTVMATGGMRDYREQSFEAFNLLETAVETYIASLDSTFKSATYQTITGKEEALYGWAASNYLLRKLPTLGIKNGLVNYLEMGGATAQIAFRTHVYKQLKAGGANPNPTAFAKKLMRVHIWGEEIDLYLRTYPLGSVSALATHETAVQHLPGWDTIDPCKPGRWAGDLVKRDNQGKKTGGGNVSAAGLDNFNYARCKQLSGLLLRYQMFKLGTTDLEDNETYPKPGKALPAVGVAEPVNLLNGSPGLTSRSQFVGGANFYYTTRSTFGRDDWGHPKEMAHNYLLLDKEVKDRAELSFDHQIIASKKNTLDPVDKEFLVNGIFTAAWVIAVLKGFGIWEGENEINFQPYNGPIKDKIDHRPELSWTLGAAFIDACNLGRSDQEKVLQVVDSNGAHNYISGYHSEDADGRLLDRLN
ncbi:Golgi apyrase [Maublancomyces gigas]|uniref:Golgi apyrase n=1 Tax=Discina gigas TaxID=1032678 RepID=A0ABR3GQX3_9PEZI